MLQLVLQLGEALPNLNWKKLVKWLACLGGETLTTQKSASLRPQRHIALAPASTLANGRFNSTRRSLYRRMTTYFLLLSHNVTGLPISR